MPKKAKEKTEVKEKKTEKLSQEAFEKKVTELAGSGLTAEKIGEALRREGIHPKEFGKKISKVLGSRYVSPDKVNLQKKLEKIEKHFKENKKDKRAMRDKERISASLRRLNKYLGK